MTQRRQFLLGACAALLPLPLLAQTASIDPKSVVPSPVQPTNVIDALAAAGQYDTFIELVSRSGGVDQLRGAGPFTLLAPSNAAMMRMPSSLREDLSPSTGGSGSQRQDPDRVRLNAFANMHIVEGRYGMAELANRVTVMRTRNGNMVEVNAMQPNNITLKIVGDSGFGVGGVNVRVSPVVLTGPEILCSNGVVLPISEPLIQ